jgi:hypothetical protein
MMAIIGSPDLKRLHSQGVGIIGLPTEKDGDKAGHLGLAQHDA